jgi:polar amino acid transport system substrate-binding protein
MKFKATRPVALAGVTLSALMVAAGLSACSSGGGSSASGSSSKGTLVIATTGDAAPYTETAKSGTLTGYDVELCTKIATALGYQVKFTAVAFAATIPGVQSKRFDAVCSGVSETPVRLADKGFELTDPTIADGVSALILKKDAAKYPTIMSLKTQSAKMGTIEGAAEETAIDSYVGEQLPATQYPGAAQAILDLENGRIDAIGTGYLSAAYYAKQDSALSIITPEISPIGDGIVLQQKSPLLKGFDEQIAKMLTDGELAALQRKWFGVASLPGKDIAKPSHS